MVKLTDEICSMIQQYSVCNRIEYIALFSLICRLIRTVKMLKAAVPIDIAQPCKVFCRIYG